MALLSTAASQLSVCPQGVDGGDVDLPTVFESSWIVGFFSKVFFTFIYLAIYAVRPLLVRPKAPSEWALAHCADWQLRSLGSKTGTRVVACQPHGNPQLLTVPSLPPPPTRRGAAMADLVNWVLVIGVDVGVLYFLGIKSLVYLLAGSLLGGGLHPMAGHLIAGARAALACRSLCCLVPLLFSRLPDLPDLPAETCADPPGWPAHTLPALQSTTCLPRARRPTATTAPSTPSPTMWATTTSTTTSPRSRRHASTRCAGPPARPPA